MDRRNLLKGAVALIVAPASALAIPAAGPVVSVPHIDPLTSTVEDPFGYSRELPNRRVSALPDNREQLLLIGMMTGLVAYVHDGGKDLERFELELEDQLRAKYGMEPRQGVAIRERLSEAA